MKLAVIVIATLLLGTLCTAQSVPVVALSSADVAKVERIHQAMLDAEKQWADLQTEISNRYLIVDKDDPDASSEEWYPEDKSNTLTWATGATTTLMSITSGDSYRCETAEEKKAHLAREEKLQKEQEQREQEREAKSRRYRKGWVKSENCYNCGTKDFEYSADWKYLIPKQTPPPTIQQQWPIILNNAGTSTSGGLLDNQSVSVQ